MDGSLLYGQLMPSAGPGYPGISTMPQPVAQYLPQSVSFAWNPSPQPLFYPTTAFHMPLTNQQLSPPSYIDHGIPHGLQGYAPLQSYQHQGYGPVQSYIQPRSGLVTPYNEPRTPYNEPRSPAEFAPWTDGQVPVAIRCRASVWGGHAMLTDCISAAFPDPIPSFSPTKPGE
jgi:hypothetical protein